MLTLACWHVYSLHAEVKIMAVQSYWTILCGPWIVKEIQLSKSCWNLRNTTITIASPQTDICYRLFAEQSVKCVTNKHCQYLDMIIYLSWAPCLCWLVHRWYGLTVRIKLIWHCHLLWNRAVNAGVETAKQTHLPLPIHTDWLFLNAAEPIQSTYEVVLSWKLAWYQLFPVPSCWPSRHYDNEGHCCSQLQCHMGWPGHKADVDNLSTNTQGMAQHPCSD